MSERLAKELAKLKIQKFYGKTFNRNHQRQNQQLSKELTGYYQQLYLCNYWEDFYGESHTERKAELTTAINRTTRLLKHLRGFQPY
jgi:hypothetical protein